MRRRQPAARGFTLVELLVSIALATIIVGVVAAVSSQAQRAVALAGLREDAARTALAILNDIERDLSGLLPATTAPPPFSRARVLELEAIDPRPAPARDRLRVLTTVRSPDGGADLVRGFAEWGLGPRVVDDAGGPDTGPLSRQIVSWARPGDATPTTGPLPTILATNVVSFELEWQGQDGQFLAPDASTRAGQGFVLEGTVDVTQPATGTLLTATSGTGAALDALPIGAELALRQPAGPPLRLLVRRRPGPGTALVNDRYTPPPAAVAGDPPPPVAWSAFRGPLALRVTIVLPFGRGPEAGTARFSRTFQVPR